MTDLTRRQLLTAASALGLASLAACSRGTSAAGTGATGAASAGRKVVTARLTPGPVTVDLGGTTVKTWAGPTATPCQGR